MVFDTILWSPDEVTRWRSFIFQITDFQFISTPDRRRNVQKHIPTSLDISTIYTKTHIRERMSSIPKTTSKITILLLLSSRFYFCLCDDVDVYAPTYTHTDTHIFVQKGFILSWEKHLRPLFWMFVCLWYASVSTPKWLHVFSLCVYKNCICCSCTTFMKMKGLM